MHRFMTRARMFALAAFGAMALSAAPAAAAEAGVQLIGYTAESANARIVNVYRTREAVDYRLAPARVSDGRAEWEPMSYRETVHVIVEMRDENPSRADADDRGYQRVTLRLDPATLTAEQNEALSQRRLSRRLAAFDLAVTDASTTVRAVDYARSRFCGEDEMRCADEIVYREAAMTAINLRVA